MEEDDEKNPLEDLIHIIQILMEEPDKLEKIKKMVPKSLESFLCLPA